MIFVKLYRAEGDPEKGGGGGAGSDAPKGYKPLNAQQRRNWNTFLDYMQKSGVAGSKELDATDKSVGLETLRKYNKENPDAAIDEALIPSIQYEQKAFRSGKEFPGLKGEQLNILRKQVNPAYLQRPVADPGTPFNAALSREYYPQFRKGEKDYGTDMSAYLKDFSNPTSDSSTSTPNADRPKDAIPLPNYSDTTSRENFAQQWAKKYKIEQGYGDIPLRVNERPYKGTDTSKNIATKAGKATGIDPALIYSSSMVEGMSGLFPNKEGKVRFGDDPDYPIQGASVGLNNFVSRIPEMKEKGYLPKDFDESRYKKYEPTAEELKKNPRMTKDSPLFKTTDDAVLAHAARLRLDYDEIDNYAKKEKIKLTPEARDFFSLVHFNSGLGKQMLDEYNKNGYLKDNAFLKERPTKGEGLKETSYGPIRNDKGEVTDPGVYAHVILRIKEQQALKKEKQFDDGDKDKNTL